MDMIYEWNFFFEQVINIQEHFPMFVVYQIFSSSLFWGILCYLLIWKFWFNFYVNSCDGTLCELDNTIQFLTFQFVFNINSTVTISNVHNHIQ